MSTTTLYAELVVVGTGATIFVLLLFYCLTGDSSMFIQLGGLIEKVGAVSVIPALSIIYLLGVLNTNVAFLLFKWLENRLRRKAMGKNKQYGEITNKLYTSSYKDLIDDFHFRRSKIRICRGWFVNFLLILVALIIGANRGHVGPSIARLSIATVVVMMIVSGVSWWAATDTELKELHYFDNKPVREHK